MKKRGFDSRYVSAVCKHILLSKSFAANKESFMYECMQSKQLFTSFDLKQFLKDGWVNRELAIWYAAYANTVTGTVHLALPNVAF